MVLVSSSPIILLRGKCSFPNFEKLIEMDSSIFLPYLVKYASQYAILGNYNKAASIIESYKNILPSYLKNKAAELLAICSGFFALKCLLFILHGTK